MLKVGERAPEIDKTASDGTRFVLSAQGGLCTVIYFFPRAFTPGCTIETKQFRDNHVEIALAGASIVGISTDDHKTQCRFANSLKTPFPMLADDDLGICRSYGVLWPILAIARRVTFIIGPDMHAAAVFRHELHIKKHRDQVLSFINERFLATRPQMVPAPPRFAPPITARPPAAAPPQRGPHPSSPTVSEVTVPRRASTPPPHALEISGPSSRKSDARGVVIAGRFELECRAAGGASGDIYQAVDRGTERKVAVKILRSGPSRDDPRFEREATLLAELRHPGIVEYIAHGIEPSGEAYLVTEWLEGESLARRLSRGLLTIDESLTLGIRVATALGAAHHRGIIHRDLKPSNLFLVGSAVDDVKLIDFGISRPASGDSQITASGDVIGTPGYIAPEQARARGPLDARADVFSLGCVLFKCLTGEAAFKGNDMSVLRAEVPRASDVRPEVPPVVSDLLAKMLSKTPEGRPADGHAVAAELAAMQPDALDAEHPHMPSRDL